MHLLRDETYSTWSRQTTTSQFLRAKILYGKLEWIKDVRVGHLNLGALNANQGGSFRYIRNGRGLA